LCTLFQALDRSGQSEETLTLPNRAASIANRMTPDAGRIDFSDLQRISEFCASHHKLEEEDKVLRKGSSLLRESSETNSCIGQSSLDMASGSLIDKYKRLEEFDKAESLVSVVVSAEDPGRRVGWARELSDLYLRHAAKLKESGQKAKSKKLLALSNQQFE